MSSVLPSLICMASRRKHAQPGSLLQSANMCDFLLQREQDTMLPLILSHPMFLREIGSRQTKKRAALSFCLGGQGRLEDDFFLFNVSLTRHSCRSGSISPLEIIPPRHFPANQDHFPRRESSLQKLFIKSGSISPTKIIPAKAFHQIRINLPDENHPSQTFLSNQDSFPAENASPAALSGKSE